MIHPWESTVFGAGNDNSASVFATVGRNCPATLGAVVLFTQKRIPSLLRVRRYLHFEHLSMSRTNVCVVRVAFVVASGTLRSQI